jgi:predicted DNA-binding transcriptional regulator YafY
VAFDLDRDDWRTFRIDRIRGRVRLAERGRARVVPGGDPAAFVKQRLQPGADEPEAAPGQIRVGAPAAQVRKCVPGRHAVVVPEDEHHCIVTTRGAWSRYFLVWMTLLNEPTEILGPPELIAAARALAGRLSAATANRGASGPD